MVDHSWLISAMRDIRDYAVMNGLGHLVPVVKAACAAVEQGIGASAKAEREPGLSSLEADFELAAALDSAMYLEESRFLLPSNLKRLSGRPRR